MSEEKTSNLTAKENARLRLNSNENPYYKSKDKKDQRAPMEIWDHTQAWLKIVKGFDDKAVEYAKSIVEEEFGSLPSISVGAAQELQKLCNCLPNRLVYAQHLPVGVDKVGADNELGRDNIVVNMAINSCKDCPKLDVSPKGVFCTSIEPPEDFFSVSVGPVKCLKQPDFPYPRTTERSIWDPHALSDEQYDTRNYRKFNCDSCRYLSTVWGADYHSTCKYTDPPIDMRVRFMDCPRETDNGGVATAPQTPPEEVSTEHQDSEETSSIDKILEEDALEDLRQTDLTFHHFSHWGCGECQYMDDTEVNPVCMYRDPPVVLKLNLVDCPLREK